MSKSRGLWLELSWANSELKLEYSHNFLLRSQDLSIFPTNILDQKRLVSVLLRIFAQYFYFIEINKIIYFPAEAGKQTSIYLTSDKIQISLCTFLLSTNTDRRGWNIFFNSSGADWGRARDVFSCYFQEKAKYLHAPTLAQSNLSLNLGFRGMIEPSITLSHWTVD